MWKGPLLVAWTLFNGGWRVIISVICIYMKMNEVRQGYLDKYRHRCFRGLIAICYYFSVLQKFRLSSEQSTHPGRWSYTRARVSRNILFTWRSMSLRLRPRLPPLHSSKKNGDLNMYKMMRSGRARMSAVSTGLSIQKLTKTVAGHIAARILTPHI